MADSPGSDDITIGIGADTSGLDDAERRSLAFADRFAAQIGTLNKSIPPLDLDVGPLASSLKQAGGDVTKFFAEIRSLGQVGGVQALDDLARSTAIAGLKFRATSEEGRAFEAVVKDIRAAQQTLAQTGTLPTLTRPATVPAAVPPPAALATPVLPALRGDESQQLRLLAALTEEEARQEAQLNATSRAAAGLAAAETQLAFTMAQQSRAGAEATASARVQAAEAVRAQEQINQAQRLAVAAAQPTVIRAPLPPVRPTLLGSQDDTRLAQSAEKNAAATARLNVELERAQGRFIQVERAIGPVVSGADKMAAGIANASTITGRGTAAFESHATGARRATTAIANLAATSIGAEGPLARLAESALLFSGGEIAVVGAAAGLLAVAVTYRFITTAEREAREEQDKYVAGLLNEANNAVPAATRAAQALTAALEAQRRAREGLTLKDVGAGLATAAKLLPSQVGGAIGEEVTRRREKAETDAARAIGQAELDLQRVREDANAAAAQGLTQLVGLRGLDAAAQREATDLVRLLKRESEDANRPLEDRIKKLQLANGLQQALANTPLQQAQRSAANQAGQDDLALQQQAIGAQQDALKAAFAAELITRDQFFQQRRALAVRAEQADVAALRGELGRTATQDRTQLNDAQNVALDATIRRLGTQITLRQDLLSLQEKQLEAERLNTEELLRQQRAIRITQAGGGNLTAGAGGVGNIPSETSPVFGVRNQGLATDVPLILQGARAREDMAANTERLAKATKQAELNALALEILLGQVDLHLKDIGNADVGADAFREMQDGALAVIDGIGRIGNALEDVGVISRETARDFSDLVDLGKSIASGDIAGIISGGIRIVGDLLGPSEAERERNRVLDQNNELLRRNNAELANNLKGVGGLGSDAALLASLASQDRLLALVQQGGTAADSTDRGKLQFGAEEARKELARQLAAAGTDIRAFAAEIKAETGIQILDEKGRLVAKAFEQAQQAIDVMVKSATSFALTFDEQTRRLDLQSRLFGDGALTDQQSFQNRIDAASILSPAIADAFKGIDLGNRPEVRAALQDLFKKFDEGFFTANPELFGGLSKTDFLDVLNQGADYLDRFNVGVLGATKNLQNVPDISTLAELEFQARSPFNRPGDGASLPPFPPVTVTPGRPGVIDINPPVLSRFAEPVSAALVKLGGGATLQTVVDAFKQQAAPAPAILNQSIGVVNVTVQGKADDPAATAQAVRAEFIRVTLRSGGREGPGAG